MRYVDGDVLMVCPYCGNEYGNSIQCCGEHYGHATYIIYGDPDEERTFDTEAEANAAADLLFPVTEQK